MTSGSDKRRGDQVRTYDRAKSVVFLKTNEAFGGLSNMAGGFPLQVNGLRILTSEALYQACRFPHRPEVQRLIIEQASPMTAKMKSKPYRRDSRPDWDQVRVKIMRWCLRVKLAQNWAKFSDLLLATREHPIVEESRKDDFWGAKPANEQTLVGTNVLGRLLMELREEIKGRERASLLRVEPPAIPDFRLDGQVIQLVLADGTREDERARRKTELAGLPSTPSGKAVQASLFDQPNLPGRAAPSIRDARQTGSMIANFRPYSVMKDSGVPWLGKVPEHWDLRRTKTLLRERSEKGFPSERLLAATQTKGVVRKEQYENRTVLALKDLHVLKFVRVGDFVISLRSFQGGIEYAHDQGIISPAYTILYPAHPGMHGFLAWLFKSKPYVDNLSLYVTGIRQGQNIDYEKLSRSEFPVPPLPEQFAIVRFLDHADRRIRRYIRAKQKLIALLNEQKQAIIHRAVTRGLDPNVRLKPSGVEWLGEVPEHWEVRRVKQASRILRGKFTHRPRNDPSLYDGPYPFIQTGEVARAEKSITGYRQTLNERGLAVSKMFPAGTLVMTIAANIGDVAVLDFEACFPDSVVGFVPRSGVDRDYLYYLFRAMKPELLREAPVNTQGNLNVDRIGSRGIALPPASEQQVIVEYIEESTLGLNAAIDRAQREISLFREYRTRLIADVVTGKLDVREAAARLPDHTEELDLFDEADALIEAEKDTADDLDAAPEEAEA